MQFYEKNGKMLPGKKGISLNMDQFKILRQIMKDGTIDDLVKGEGGSI